MAKPGIMFYFDVRPCLKRLDIEEKGALFEAMLDYGELGIEPELEGKVGVAWDFVRPSLDRDTGRYEQTVLQRKYAVHIREAKRKQEEPIPFPQWVQQNHQMISNDNFCCEDASNDIQLTTDNLQLTTNNLQHTNSNSGAPAVFSPPSRESVMEYCREMRYELDVDAFMDYYTANGWMIGKSPMRDWKAAVRRWQRKETGNETAEHSSIWDSMGIVL